MSDIICVPDYKAEFVNYAIETKTLINEIQRDNTRTYPQPPKGILEYLRAERARTARMEHTQFFSQFIFNASVGRVGGGRTLTEDIEEIIKFLKEQKLCVERFIEERTEKYIPDFSNKLPEKTNIDSFYYEVTYLRIREPIVTYLERVIGITKETLFFKKLFVKQTNINNFQEYLEKKSRQLMNTDLDTWLEDIKHEEENKRKENLLEIQT